MTFIRYSTYILSHKRRVCLFVCLCVCYAGSPRPRERAAIRLLRPVGLGPRRHQKYLVSPGSPPSRGATSPPLVLRDRRSKLRPLSLSIRQRPLVTKWGSRFHAISRKRRGRARAAREAELSRSEGASEASTRIGKGKNDARASSR